MLLPIWNYLEGKQTVFYYALCIFDSPWIENIQRDWGSLWRERLDQFAGGKHVLCGEGLKMYF